MPMTVCSLFAYNTGKPQTCKLNYPLLLFQINSICAMQRRYSQTKPLLCLKHVDFVDMLNYILCFTRRGMAAPAVGMQKTSFTFAISRAKSLT